MNNRDSENDPKKDTKIDSNALEVPKEKTVASAILASKQSTDSASQPLTGVRILVVDDVYDNRALMMILLRKLGALGETASSGPEALEMAAAQTYDLVFMDIQMPLMDGFETFARLRESGFAKPVVALTAHAFEDERRRILTAGFAGHLTKPVNKTLLLQTILEKIEAKSELRDLHP